MCTFNKDPHPCIELVRYSFTRPRTQTQQNCVCDWANCRFVETPIICVLCDTWQQYMAWVHRVLLGAVYGLAKSFSAFAFGRARSFREWLWAHRPFAYGRASMFSFFSLLLGFARLLCPCQRTQNVLVARPQQPQCIRMGILRIWNARCPLDCKTGYLHISLL